MPLHIADIQRRVAQHFGITAAELTGPGKARRCSRPRQVAMYLARELTPASLPRIGRAFARDHTTVLHSLIVVERRLRSDAAFVREVWALKTELRRAAGLNGITC